VKPLCGSITSLKVDAETLILGENNNARTSSSACPNGCYVTWDLLDLTIAQLQTTLDDLQCFCDRVLVLRQDASEVAEPSKTPEPSKMPEPAEMPEPSKVPDPSELAIVPYEGAGPEKMSLEQVLATPVTSQNLGLQLSSMMAIMNGPENPFKGHEDPTAKVEAKAKATPRKRTKANAKAAAKKRPSAKAKAKSKATKAKAKAKVKARPRAPKASANSKRKQLQTKKQKQDKSANKPADVNPKRPRGPQLTDEQKAEKKKLQKLMHSVSWSKDYN